MSRTEAWKRALRGALAPLFAAGLLGACADESPPLHISSVELDAPAGEGSGEPFLSSVGDIAFLSWLERVAPGEYELRYSGFRHGSWDEAVVIASGRNFFVNWADFPSVTAGPDGTLWAHWLERSPEGGIAYGIRLAHSTNEGRTWSESWTLHDDDSATEHGFVAAVPVNGAAGFLWLDGRRFATGTDGSPPTREMALMFRSARPDAHPGPETVVDSRVCDCCQTDAALTAAGPVAVYRDRSPEEIRDIYITRYVDGVWTAGEVVHRDGWETGACPVNGPAVAARDERVAVAWFTAAGNEPIVKVAFSRDSGQRFGEPVVVDAAAPAGRVDAVLLDDGSALVSWLARTGGDAAEVRVRRVHPSGRAEPSLSVSASSSERASGFPRMAQTEGGTVLLAWTDLAELESRVRVARIHMEVEAR